MSDSLASEPLVSASLPSDSLPSAALDGGSLKVRHRYGGIRGGWPSRLKIRPLI
jgi:hypothetical protein